MIAGCCWALEKELLHNFVVQVNLECSRGLLLPYLAVKLLSELVNVGEMSHVELSIRGLLQGWAFWFCEICEPRGVYVTSL